MCCPSDLSPFKVTQSQYISYSSYSPPETLRRVLHHINSKYGKSGFPMHKIIEKAFLIEKLLFRRKIRSYLNILNYCNCLLISRLLLITRVLLSSELPYLMRSSNIRWIFCGFHTCNAGVWINFRIFILRSRSINRIEAEYGT